MSLKTLYLVRHAPVIKKSGVIYGDEAEIDLETTKNRIVELAGTLSKKGRIRLTSLTCLRKRKSTTIRLCSTHKTKKCPSNYCRFGQSPELAESLPSPDMAEWICSGVDRASQTAKAVLTAMAFDDYDVITHAGFREQNFGDLIGKKHEDVTEHLSFIDGKIYAPVPPNGESIETLISRVENAITDLKNKENKAFVIFCHGGTIRAARIVIEKLEINRFIELDTPPLFCYKGVI